MRLAAFLAAACIRLLRLTWRARICGPAPPADRPVIYCFWHGRQAGLLAHPLRRETVVMTSRSRDGELQSHIMRTLGFRVVRGSSSRGGAGALKGLVDALRKGADAALAVDGPRGPAFRAKSGAAQAASRSGAALVPVTVTTPRYWGFAGSWDDFRLPKPFARVRVERGPAIEARGGAAELTSLLERAIAQLDGRERD